MCPYPIHLGVVQYTMSAPPIDRLNNCIEMIQFLTKHRSLMETEINQIIDEDIPIIQIIMPAPNQQKIDWKNFHKIYALQKRLKPIYKAVYALLEQEASKHAQSQSVAALSSTKEHPNKAIVSNSLLATAADPSAEENQREEVDKTITQKYTNVQQALMSKSIEDIEQVLLEESQDEELITEIKKQKENARQKIAEYKFKVEMEREAKKAFVAQSTSHAKEALAAVLNAANFIEKVENSSDF